MGADQEGPSLTSKGEERDVGYLILGGSGSKESFPVKVTPELRTVERKKLACEARREEQVSDISWRFSK